MNFILRFRLAILTGLAITQVFSSVWFVPGGEGIGGSVFRVLLLLLVGVLALTTGLRDVSALTRRGLLAGVLLIGWMMLSLAWSENVAGGLRQISYVATTVMLIYVLEVLVRGIRDFSFLSAVIVLSSIGIVCFAFYEIQTGNHFSSALLNIDDHDSSLSYITQGLAWFTFGNPNDLAVHVMFGCFVAAVYLSGLDWRGLMVIVFIGVCIYLADQLRARLAMGSMAAFVGVFCASFAHRKASFGALAAGCASVVGALLVVSALALKDRVEFVDTSSFVRLQLLTAAIEMSVNTFFAGIGVGSFETHVSVEGIASKTYGVLSPHNAIGRMLAENGVIGVALFGYLIFGPLAGLRQYVRQTRLSAFVAASIAALPLLFSAGSDPMSASTLSFFVATVWVAARLASNVKGRPRQKAFTERGHSGVQPRLERAL